MFKVFAKIFAILVVCLAVFAIYSGVKTAYLNKAVQDYIAITDSYVNNKIVDPSIVEDKTDDGKFIKRIAIYYKDFQELNVSQDTQMHRLFTAFDPQNLSDQAVIKINLAKMEEFKILVERDNKKLAEMPVAIVSDLEKMDLKNLKFGSIEDVKKSMAENQKFRDSLASYRSTIASYLLAALEFANSRFALIKISEQGALTFASPADQEYFYGLMNSITKMDRELANLLAKNREESRQEVANLKQAVNR